MRVAIYCRVSTDQQSVDNQRLELESVAQRRKWDVVQIYHDIGISGAKGRDKRPGLDAALKACTRREVDLLACWSVDRLGRSLTDLLALLGELHAIGCDLYLHQQGIDTTTPAGKAMFQLLGVFAEFERSMIVDRVRAGIARMKASGKTKSGKPSGRPRITKSVELEILSQFKSGKGKNRISKDLGLGSGTVQRVIREQQANQQAQAQIQGQAQEVIRILGQS